MAQKLGRRQERTFIRRVHLWKPERLNVATDGSVGDLAWESAPTFRNVPAMHMESQEENQAVAGVGRHDYDIMATTDQFKFLSDQEIGDGWLVMDATPGSVNRRQCYVVQGGPRDRQNAFRRGANQRTVYAKPCTRPQYIEVPPEFDGVGSADGPLLPEGLAG